ncbi:DUF262 domain-containing protein [soil metagenome]
MSASTFDSGKEFLSDLLKELASGDVQLPDFQRGWVWDDEHIRSLVASVASAYPIGAVMMLETGGEAKFQPRPVEGVDFGKKKPEAVRLILDGQQRLTSLFQATLLRRVVETQNAKKQRIKRWYYFDMERALNGDMEDAVVGIPEARQVVNFRGEVEQDYSSKTLEYQACLFPLTDAFEAQDWRRGFNEHWHHAKEKTALFDLFEHRVLDTVRRYQIPVITLKKNTPKVAVCQVFEKVNTGGVALNAFELVTATYAADNFSLRDDWFGPKENPGGRRGRLWQDPVLKGVRETDFLQAVTLLHTLDLREKHVEGGKAPDDAPAVSAKRVAMLNLPLSAYLKWADLATQGFLKAAKLLRLQHVYSARDLPYQTQLVPLAAALTRLGKKADNDGVRKKIARWIWCGVFGELYGGAVESRFAFDVPDLLAWVAGGEEPRTVREALFDPSRLLTLRSRLSAAYKGLHAVLMREGGADFLSGQPITFATFADEKIDIHHIFPQKWCVDAQIPRPRYDCIVNKTALSARTNRVIGKKAPSVYLGQLQKDAEMLKVEFDAVLKTHVIEPPLLRADDFDAFFEARRIALLERIAGAMGKPVAAGGLVEPIADAADLDDDDDESASEADLDAAAA